MKVAFIVSEFPVVSTTFIINQVADLIDQGIEVDIFSFERGALENISDRFFEYAMSSRTTYLDVPRSKLRRVLDAAIIAARLLVTHPRVLLRALNIHTYGVQAHSLRTLFWTAPFIDRSYDVIHCHFGTVANKFLIVRDILKDTTPLVTTFYGYDVSHTIKEKGISYYDTLKKECHLYFVMSRNMKERVQALGFNPDEIEVLPVSIAVNEYPFHERARTQGRPVRAVTVARLVEKKGIDDIIRAAKILKERKVPITFEVIGGGPLESELKRLAVSLQVEDKVMFLGPMKQEDITALYQKIDVYIQPSKTAADGDME